MKKLVVFIIGLIALFLLFLFIYLTAHDYKLEYILNGVNITEEYHKSKSYYEFTFNYKEKEYNLIALEKYTTKRKLIDDIKIKEKDDEVCLDFSSHYVKLYPICSNNDTYTSAYLNDNSDFQEEKNYENIKINDLNNNTYLLWNYHSFIYLSPKKQTKISLFDKDIYNLNLIYQMDENLLVPDYNSNYKFKSLNIINSKTGKVKTMNLRYEVYFESYFLGHEKNKAYLYDNKNEQEFYFDLKKNDINKTSFKVLKNNKWEKVTNQKLKNSKLTFEEEKLFSYTLEDDNLIAQAIDSDMKFQVTNRKVSTIVKQDNLDVYYISKDTLYYFNPLDGEKALLKYSEWEFNNNNMIFIF